MTVRRVGGCDIYLCISLSFLSVDCFYLFCFLISIRSSTHLNKGLLYLFRDLNYLLHHKLILAGREGLLIQDLLSIFICVFEYLSCAAIFTHEAWSSASFTATDCMRNISCFSPHGSSFPGSACDTDPHPCNVIILYLSLFLLL